MSLKDQLLSESKNLDTTVELDSVFESVELNEDTKAKFSAVFESAVKARALTLAESHIEEIASRADALVESRVEEQVEEINESVNSYFDHLVENWKEENKVSLETGMKVDLFESLMGSLKAVFVEHNIDVPTESINVVSEMEAELAESSVELDKMLRSNKKLNEELNALKMKDVVKEATAELTESQKEKVANLVEGLKFDDKFKTKLDAIVEMVGKKSPSEEAKSPKDTAEQEKAQTKAATDQTKKGAASKMDEDLDGLNGDKEDKDSDSKKKDKEDELKESKVPSYVDVYANAV